MRDRLTLASRLHRQQQYKSSSCAAIVTMYALLSGRYGRRWQVWTHSIVGIAALAVAYAVLPRYGDLFSLSPLSRMRVRQQGGYPKLPRSMPAVLLEKRLYSDSDLLNEDGIIPSFWNEKQRCINGVCQDVWGPCFPPQNDVKWNTLVENGAVIEYALQKQELTTEDSGTYQNFCRPGFLIIGQGKCGTSSLYHYLVGHPRVLPASEKQIHYFKYYARYGLKWYMGHFPTAESFMANGALMTGEASPGYLPYPEVVALTKKEMAGTKIICVGRDPLGRSWSSYRYNYINPAIEIMRNGKAPGIAKNKSDEYYHQYLYSFEEMLRAELKTIKACIAPGGPGEQGAKERWGQEPWGKEVFAERKRKGLPPLLDLDGTCYGDFISKTVPRRQWQELVDSKPHKFLNVPSLHLSQAMIGRSLYVYPLEWWYAMHPHEDIYFLCTEEMRDMTGEPINQIGKFLGLPSFNFSGIVNAGAYNVGGHKGYDKVTSWETVDVKKEEGPREQVNLTKATTPSEEDEIPLSDEFRQEMLDFYKSHNERLFKLVGRRCNWD